jgi:hypothetical protein
LKTLHAAARAGLDEVTAEDVIQLLVNHGQQLSYKDLEVLNKEISQQKERQRKSLKTSAIQRILSAMETVTDEFCETDHDWKGSAEVKTEVNCIPWPLILDSQRKKKWDTPQPTLHAIFFFFSKKERSSQGAS